MEAPKRITRSRAKAGSEKPATKIITAAAAAKKAAPAAPISRKRLRSDDGDHDEDDDDELGGAEPAQGATKLRTAARAARGRPRKAEAVDETKPAEPAPAPKPRGRPAKKLAPAKEEPLAAAPVRATRTTRAKKTEPPPEPQEAAEPLKPATRARATTAATAAKATVKKSVKFEEPEKENTPPIAPKTKRVKAAAAEPPAPVAAEPATTGLRARPLRRAAAAAPSAPARATRGSAKSTAAPAAQKEERPATPLGPKRITQLTRAKNADRGDESDDELAGDDAKTSQRPLMKSPVRPAPAARPELELPVPAPAVDAEENPTLNPPDLTITAATNLLSSPARRPAASPYKDTMKSPARRGVGAPLLALPEAGSATAQDIKSPLKTSLLCSPAKRPKSPMKTMQAAAPSLGDVSRSPMKASLLNSPAKRLFSPAKPKRPDEAKKVEENEGEEKENEEEQQPAEMEFRSPATEPVLLTAPVGLGAEYLPAAARQAQTLESPTRQLFPGRLSAVLPRHADPALKDTVMGAVARVNAEQAASQEEEEAKPEEVHEEIESVAGEAMDVDEPTVQVASEENASSRPGFGLRQKDLDPYAGVDSESDDEPGTPAATTSRQAARATQTPSRSTRQAGRGLSLGVQSSSKSAIKKMSESSGLGFTPLAEKLNGWRASSPLKVGAQSGPPAATRAAAVEAQEETFIGAERVSATGAQDSPAKSTFFDDEMLVRAGLQIEESAVIAQNEVEQQLEMEVDEPDFGDLPITQEDVELAAEAHEMSLLDQSRLEERLCAETSMDDSISEASQEYGDENQTPIDPALMVQDQQPSGSASPGIPPVTPQRFVTRTFHTVSKIPLKPADESTPRSALAEAKQSRRHSVAKLPGATTPTKSRPNNGLARNATVISYSPTKADRQAEEADEVVENPQTTSAPATPVRSESGFSWSTTGTPARTPRRDVNPALLRGAVVFVDVRTSEGADSSEIFVELLSQMGAVCLRSWDWTPDEADSVSKVGITHVVFKDGSNQTIQKVRECGGVVQCVGVSWVLDCERENEWLEEAPYSIDTSLTPRGGGGRRRKTMDPNAFSNANGSGNRRRDRRSSPATPTNNRRDSSLWIRTPVDDELRVYGDGEDGDESEWQLTPVPKTPAPEAVARYAAAITPDGMSSNGSGPATPLSTTGAAGAMSREELMMRTCPPPKQAAGANVMLGAGLLAHDKDEGVLQRLMAARRKSLQFAPRVGSPLAKTWQ